MWGNLKIHVKLGERRGKLETKYQKKRKVPKGFNPFHPAPSFVAPPQLSQHWSRSYSSPPSAFPSSSCCSLLLKSCSDGETNGINMPQAPGQLFWLHSEGCFLYWGTRGLAQCTQKPGTSELLDCFYTTHPWEDPGSLTSCCLSGAGNNG